MCWRRLRWEYHSHKAEIVTGLKHCPVGHLIWQGELKKRTLQQKQNEYSLIGTTSIEDQQFGFLTETVMCKSAPVLLLPNLFFCWSKNRPVCHILSFRKEFHILSYFTNCGPRNNWSSMEVVPIKLYSFCFCWRVLFFSSPCQIRCPTGQCFRPVTISALCEWYSHLNLLQHILFVCQWY